MYIGNGIERKGVKEKGVISRINESKSSGSKI
jgi:hypothetical protein